MLAEERRQRLVAAMREAGIGHMVLYGNAWQGDYLRYGADFGILEGHGIVMVAADGDAELFLDSATDAERAEREGRVKVQFAPISRAPSGRGWNASPTPLAAAPRRFMPAGSPIRRGVQTRGRHRALDKLLMHKLPEIAAIRRAAQIADDAYGEFIRAVGRAGGNTRSSPTLKPICGGAVARTIS